MVYKNANKFQKILDNVFHTVYNETTKYQMKRFRGDYMSKQKSSEQYTQEIEDIWGNEFTILEPYINCKSKILVRHNCGYEYRVQSGSLLQGFGCPKCARKKQSERQLLSHEEFIKQIYELVANEYTILSQYKGDNVHVTIKHNTCGHIYSVKPTNFKQGKRCPKCAIKKVTDIHRKTNEEFVNDIKKLVGNEYIPLEKYTSAKHKITFKHMTCKNIFKADPDHFINAGTRCPYCNGGIISNLSEFKKTVYELEENNYHVLGSYVNSQTKILMFHAECGNKYYVRPSDFKQGKRCPYCASSKGEKIINTFFNFKKINYKREYRIKDCKHIRPLPFDFAVFQQNKIKTLIEYDGIQHFELIEYYSKHKLETIQLRDQIKNNYCKTHNIPLLRIPYTQYDHIEDILNEHLRKLNII